MFQFTQPKRAATVGNLPSCVLQSVSIHAAQAGCDFGCGCCNYFHLCFNSRSPSGLRLCYILVHFHTQLFQFTQPKRAATSDSTLLQFWSCVSIHAAQAGCDMLVWWRWTLSICFNSRSPSGLRHNSLTCLYLSLLFQFTQPKRAATCLCH